MLRASPTKYVSIHTLMCSLPVLDNHTPPQGDMTTDNSSDDMQRDHWSWLLSRASLIHCHIEKPEMFHTFIS